jgi:C-terminal peptidase prc
MNSQTKFVRHFFKFFSPASRLASLVFILLLAACSDFFHPVKSTPKPKSEYAFNYWLLQNVYMYEDELPNLQEDGDSVQILYTTLKDPYTRYIPPANSNQAITQLNTSLVEGDVGMRYLYNWSNEYPISIDRVYPKGPAGRAGVPRHGNILKANDIELSGETAATVYDSILNYSKNIDILVAHNGDTTVYKLEKETVYAPTVFVDTLFENSDEGYPGLIFIAIEGFKLNTADQKKGTYGELKAYLDSTTSDKRVRVLDLRGNPGGHVSQCISMADLFVSKGTLSTKRSRTLDADGKSVIHTSSEKAKAGDIGESGKYIILANRGSASASEIFISAVTELTDIPLVGTRTYGKGIGQTTFHTYAGGLAIITNYEFLTPKGNSYHGEGITPKYECTNTVGEVCASKIAHDLYGVKTPYQEVKALAKPYREMKDDINEFDGGAIEWEEGNFVPYRF